MLAPGSTIGILGGGQLGRMLALAAAPLGFRAHVYCPDAESPAFDVAAKHTLAAYEDAAALARFAAAVDVVTTEFENVPARTAAILSALKPVRPNPRTLATAQDRLVEKSFVHDLGIAVPDFASVDDRRGLDRALAAIGRPAVLKTRRLGYDGKGQAVIRPDSDASDAWEQIHGEPAILEEFVPFTAEISVVAVRGLDGTFAAYDVPQNVHRHGILHTSTVPCAVDPDICALAMTDARRIAEALDYVGVLAVEYFVTAEGAHLVNEIAPRVHNSGHWTLDACACSQFEAHIRAVAGWPIPALARHSDAIMTNLIGFDVEDLGKLAADPSACLHLYGKRQARAGRKMGHVTRLTTRGE
jgi:5-(carboxyamino)imidazole ribonucleotide synthase